MTSHPSARARELRSKVFRRKRYSLPRKGKAAFSGGWSAPTTHKGGYKGHSKITLAPVRFPPEREP